MTQKLANELITLTELLVLVLQIFQLIYLRINNDKVQKIERAIQSKSYDCDKIVRKFFDDEY